ncbi:MAG: PKD domain-containing protein [Pyrinomonadaceae bacterium]
MRLATRALLSALTVLVLSAAVSAQTLRSPQDPRNQAPAVGTGGPEGGPTGLFTVYDGDTIRRGEFTFSVAYSNFDRDPGDVDLVETPLSFNVGLNDHVELFFKTIGYRGIKVNNPKNLSSFYLPNNGLFFGATLLCTGPAIILPPERVSGSTQLTGFSPLFRPAGPPCNVGGQPFVQFPFIGGTGPNFGLTGNAIAPPFVSRIGTPFGGNGNFGAASNFPGIGSTVGSILPGIVLSTRTIPPNSTFNTLTVADVFTVAPAYLPDAPFIGRLYGESSFTNFVAGAKIRLTGPNNALGVGFIPFYRWNPDKANDASGFNQLQRGASPGADIGDFGLIGFISGRLSQHVSVSANLGYILNSNPKSKAMGDAILLDRPDEFLSGVGFDYVVNKHFQLIGEVRSTMYTGGRTPNAFNNNPVDAIGGVRIFPARWWGIGAAYRRHMNQQDQGHFSDTLPSVFQGSSDPNGFIFQFWAGHRNPRIPPPPPNQAPTVSVSSSSASITLPCPPGTSSPSCTASASQSVDLTADGRDPDNDTLLYTWSVTGGTLSGDGRAVSWNLSGAQPGTYTATVTVNDGNQHTAVGSTTVTIANCEGCVPPCPTVSVSCPAEVDLASPITFTASGAGDMNVTYNWTVSAGTISSGQGTSSIEVDTAGLGGQSVTATVELGGLDPSCARTASCTTSVKPEKPVPRKFDEYGNIKFNDEKARLDNYAIQLQNEPGSQGYIIAYGTCEGEAQARADRAKDYLVNTRGIDAGRLVTIDGGCRSDLMVQLWIVPTGAMAPAASTDNAISPCPACKKAAPRRRGRTRRGMDE